MGWVNFRLSRWVIFRLTFATYADLRAFQLLCGDQHKYDWWVVDDHSYSPFRVEGYVWLDFRTRVAYGAAFTKHYNSTTMNLAMRLGCKMFGPGEGVVLDHGKPEEAKKTRALVERMAKVGRSLHIQDAAAIDGIPLDLEEEDILPYRQAIVKNAKAKPIERFFSTYEKILRNTFRLPGYAKRLTDADEWQEVDQAEVKKLAAEGKLLKFSEFVNYAFKALLHYNRSPHRSVLKEWKWRNKPEVGSPLECLYMCQQYEGWQRVSLSSEALDMIFLPRAERKIQRGRINFQTPIANFYEHDALSTLETGTLVEVAYDVLDPERLMVFHDDKFLCLAVPVELSSMKNPSLSSRKIEEKRRMEKEVISEYRALTSSIPDLRQYSNSTIVPLIEKEADASRQARKEEEQLREGLQVIMDISKGCESPESTQPLQLGGCVSSAVDRPFFTDEIDKYMFFMELLIKEEAISEDEKGFIEEFEKDNPDSMSVRCMRQKMAAMCGHDPDEHPSSQRGERR